MRTKEQIKEHLINDEFYSSVIKNLDDDNKNKIMNIVEPFFIDAMTVIETLLDDINKNPEMRQELIKGLENRDSVINSAQDISGSKELTHGEK